MTNKPDCCPICGYYLTTAVQFAGSRCVDPGHWQAAGLLALDDYHSIAKIASWANTEHNQRSTKRDTLNLVVEEKLSRLSKLRESSTGYIDSYIITAQNT
jgi:hypothetical protein